MLPKPQSRLELLYEKIALGVSDNLPIPQSRMELLVKAFITGDIDNLPIPQSRSEMLLHAILKNEECNLNAQSRVELFLKAILNVDIENLPAPMSRVELFLDYIVRNGCLEKYEYYPFSFTSNITVNNTAKAKMKIKSVKGKTLVNLIKSPRAITLTKGGVDLKYLKLSQNLKPNSTYTYSYELTELNSSYLTNTVFFIITYSDNSKSYIEPLNKTILGRKVSTFTTKNVEIKNIAFSIHTGFSAGDYASIDDLMILSGDHTQNLPSYFEGMLSVGQDNKNKIEILSGTKDSTVSNKKEILLSESLKGVNDSICDEIAYLDETDINASQGKGLYHVKRCDERPYQAGDESNSNVVTDMTNTVYQLDSPIVTKIDDIEIYSHEEQTNLFVSGGAIPIMATVEVGTKIGTIVSQLRKEVKEIDEKQSQHMKYVLNGDMRAIAEDLYPNDFIENQEL